MSRNDQADGAIDARQLFDYRCILDVAESCAAEFLRKNNSQQTHLAKLGNQFGRKTRGFVPLHHVRSDFSLGKFANGPPELLLLVSEGKIHGASARCYWRTIFWQGATTCPPSIIMAGATTDTPRLSVLPVGTVRMYLYSQA